MALSEQDIFGEIADPVVVVTPPRGTKPIHLRYPTWHEYHELVKAHEGLDGKAPSAALIAKTIATCLADESGKPLSGDVVATVMKSSPRRVMWLYNKCFETVLNSTEDTVKEKEKN